METSSKTGIKINGEATVGPGLATADGNGGSEIRVAWMGETTEEIAGVDQLRVFS